MKVNPEPKMGSGEVDRKCTARERREMARYRTKGSMEVIIG